MSINKGVGLKIVILGSLGVGKTSLLNRYVNNRFTQEYRTTLGASILPKEIRVDNTLVKLQIWDTGGQERFKSLVPSFSKGSDGCVLVFDVTDRDSLYALEGWREEILLQIPLEYKDYPFVALGNKVDLTERQVTSDEAEAWCSSHNIPYFEVSAKEDINVDHAFENIARNALLQDSKWKDSYLMNSISLGDNRTSVRNNCC
ncbi:ras-related protein Rab-7b-like [Stegostoma tigrinum]|uniref:ras-related protein Rab-7b-like n=1 Tax=Stegostoma tigrinum TaxID=3053191 RepID=UPI00202AD4D4|nr:ras-related protein Rab-7b-like [Stegostoma tigrinum]XP_048409296.1 ras-related protein Rab-7b-like [Stegostoma tigrinum]XP_048409297.1 ras-related protein Rab-7b-like [Stegostoma tigrinum]XP_048409298.1 ras-related protein Rab-7b-like [Stegostoma tigrinum]XP_048409299.1 ras-related protein Rab-7b-like [Stegostoma tigrinum]XP_048409300.1 ras-related protein Rab-7b-like [Stegostoma tigrinum]XP_059509337.1 ras-related protein Rab-7b-like [Stegostoma tigrinum]